MRIAFALLLLAACPSSPRKPQPMQRTTAEGTCEEIAWSCVALKPGTEEAWGCIEGNAAQTAQYQSSCTPEKNGRFALNPCLRDNLAGGCTVARGSQCTTTWYFTPAARPTVEADCVKLGAVFVAP
jgi:hypothetical protein